MRSCAAAPCGADCADMASTPDPFGIDLERAVSASDALPADYTPDGQVEHALWRAAIGGHVQRTTVTSPGGTTITERTLPPDPKAAQAWLAAKRPATWGNALPPPTRPSIAIAVQFVTAQGAPVGSVIEVGRVEGVGQIQNEPAVKGAGIGTPR